MARLNGESLEDRKLMAADWGFINDWVDMGCPNDVVARDSDHGDVPAIFADGFESGDAASFLGRWREVTCNLPSQMDAAITADDLDRYISDIANAIAAEMDSLGDAGDAILIERSLRDGYELELAFGPLWDFDRAFSAFAVDQDLGQPDMCSVAAIDSDMESLGDAGDALQNENGINNLAVASDVFHAIDRMDHRWPDAGCAFMTIVESTGM